MSHDPPTLTLGELVDSLAFEALEAWRSQKAPTTPFSDLLAGPVTSFTEEATVFPGGRAMVIISVRGRRPWDDEVYLHRAYRMRDGAWRPASTPQR